MERKKASDYPQEPLTFPRYQHGDIDRRVFRNAPGSSAVGGLTAATILRK